MIIYLVLVLVFVIFVIFIVAFPTKTNPPQDTIKPVRGDELDVWPFVPMPIMTPTEVLFYHKLQQALPELTIFGQVQLSRMIMPDDNEATDQNFWFNRICRMSVDYVLVAEDKQNILAAIELDDWTHNSRRRQQQDDKKDKALSCAGIPVLRFHSEAMPDVVQLRKQILQVIG